MRCPPAFLPRQNAEALLSLGALQLLLPLAQDSMASVRSAATLSLGRLANVSHTWSHHLVQHNVLPSLCKALTGTNRHHKRAAAYLVKAVSRHAGAELAEAGVLPLLTECLLDAMLAVRETAACALGTWRSTADEAVARIALSVLTGLRLLSTIARHSESLALQVLDQPGASRLLLCLHDSSPSLRASAAAAVREGGEAGPAAAGAGASAAATERKGQQQQAGGHGGHRAAAGCCGHVEDAGEGEGSGEGKGMTRGSGKFRSGN
ncbi:unnamed protein product [Closterium sp. NIES-65]|nr:unnamed protein product [Closterium sp. NIES-65]